MTQHQSDVLKVAVDLVKKGATVIVDVHVFGFEIKLIQQKRKRFRVVL